MQPFIFSEFASRAIHPVTLSLEVSQARAKRPTRLWPPSYCRGCNSSYSSFSFPPKLILLQNKKAPYTDAGGAEDKVLERLLSSIADYFIDNPAPSWRRELREAANTNYQQVYAY